MPNVYVAVSGETSVAKLIGTIPRRQARKMEEQEEQENQEDQEDQEDQKDQEDQEEQREQEKQEESDREVENFGDLVNNFVDVNAEGK